MTKNKLKMDKVFLVSFLAFLIVALGSSVRDLSDDFVDLEEVEALEIEEEDGGEVFEYSPWTCQGGSNVLVNVNSFGAVGDGISDDTEAFSKAWNQACSAPNSVFLVPSNRHYLVNATRFKGPCASRLVVQIEGTIVAPDEPTNWDPKSPRTWLYFYNLTGVSFQGNGVIDGSGTKWWAASCKKNKSNPCKGAPTALTIDSSSSIRVKGLTIQNSQQMHFTIARSNSVRVSGVKISSPGDSPNTDGIHLTSSKNVVLENCKIGTAFKDLADLKRLRKGWVHPPLGFLILGQKPGAATWDDCISIVNGSSSIKMKTIYCGPGHGISIGSLGQNNSTALVEKVVLTTAFLKETTNGLRIKTYQGGLGHVRAIRFQNVRMDNVSNPIIIDQFYCDTPTACPNQTSAVEISQIVYKNISGTSQSKNAIKFACSDTVPCKHIVLNNINLEKKEGIVETYCNSVTGFEYGYVQPSAECLSSQDKDFKIEQTQQDDYIHTEL